MDTGQRQMLWVTWVNTNTDKPTHTNTLFFLSSPGLRRKLLRSLHCNTSYSVRYISKKKNQMKMKMSYVFFSLIHRINSTDAGCQALCSAVGPAFGVYCGFGLRGLTSQYADLEIVKEVVGLAAGEQRIETSPSPSLHTWIYKHTHTHTVTHSASVNPSTRTRWLMPRLSLTKLKYLITIHRYNSNIVPWLKANATVTVSFIFCLQSLSMSYWALSP